MKIITLFLNAIFCLLVSAELTPTTIHDDIPGTATIRQVVDASGYAIGELPRTNDVLSLVDSSLEGGTQNVNRVTASFDNVSNRVEKIEGKYVGTEQITNISQSVIREDVRTNYLYSAETADSTFRTLIDNEAHETVERWEHSGIPPQYSVKLGPLYSNGKWYLTLVDTSTQMIVYNAASGTADARSLTFVFYSFTVRSELRRIATEGKFFVTDDNVPTTNGFVTAQAATNAAYQVVTNAVGDGYLCTVAAAEDMTNDSRIVRGEFQGGNQWGITAANAQNSYRAERLENSNEVFAIPSFSMRSRPSYTENFGTTWNDIAYSNEVAQVQSQVSSIAAHLNAEDAHFVSTNYDSQTRTPEAYVEIKMNGNWLTIWKEMTRWKAFVGQDFDWDTWTGFYTFKTNVVDELAQKADRAWGAYDSDTGEYAPDYCTQISSSNILIAANMGFQKRVVTGGAVWVLQCNDGVASLNVDTNGYFRIEDSEGNTQFEIVRGDKQELGADASGITVNNSTTPPTVTIPYSVEADEHPTLQICGNLATHNWKAETDADCIATVTWRGSSGAYVATVQAKNAQNAASLFVKASYLAGGETYIHNVAPVGMSSIILNGTKYYLGTATISGNTVLTLSTTPPNGN